jgi:hypothetical protein
MTRPPPGRWHPISADGITLFNPAVVPIRRYRYRGNTIPTPRATLFKPPHRQIPWRAGHGETRTSGSAGGLGKRIRSNPGIAPQADPTALWAKTKRRTGCTQESSAISYREQFGRGGVSIRPVEKRSGDGILRTPGPSGHEFR